MLKHADTYSQAFSKNETTVTNQYGTYKKYRLLIMRLEIMMVKMIGFIHHSGTRILMKWQRKRC